MLMSLLGIDGELNLTAKGIWSREKEINFTKLYQKLSTFGIFGLE